VSGELPLPPPPPTPYGSDRTARTGAALAIGAYGLWGLFPIYFKWVAAVPAIEVLAHRIVWTLAVMAAVVSLRAGGWRRVGAALRQRRLAATLGLSSLLLALNWGVFVGAVAAGRVLECSLGYFINPLVSVLLGVAVLGERLRRPQWLAVALAASGVAFLVAATGVAPWVGLTLAFSFASYGLLRKVAAVDPFTGLFVEAAVLAPLALAYLVWLTAAGVAVFAEGDLAMDGLLIAAGPITALPLILFAAGARRIRLATLGLLQYIAPTGHFLLAVLAYGETFTVPHLIAFAGIWAALVIYSVDGLRQTRKIADR
jgi:chloramphenicol-sensitive protein RarD